MLTNNALTLLKNLQTLSLGSNPVFTGTLKNIAGTSISSGDLLAGDSQQSFPFWRFNKASMDSGEYNTPTPSVIRCYLTVTFGTGTTTAKVTDYDLADRLQKLPNYLTTSIQSAAGGIDESGHGYTELKIAVIAKQAVTVSEVGLFYGYLSNCTLIDRTLLDEPITMGVGDSALIKYRITNASEIPDYDEE